MLALVPCLAAASLNMSFEEVDAARLKTMVQKLAAFPTRNTLSTGLTDAVNWLASEMRAIPGLEVEVMEYTAPKGRRIPEDTKVVQLVVTLKGESDRIVLIGGHIDSLNLQVDPKVGPAPGANDDASGVASAMECARVMAGKKWKNTVKFVAFSGEEQGLLGSTALARRAVDEKWKLEAVLSNDTVGSSSNLAGQNEPNMVRVFSEEGEDHESRDLARFCEWTVRKNFEDFRVKLVLRRDRFGRGGDHTPFVAQKFSAVRFIEVHEEFTRQHTPEDKPEYMDFGYLAKVTKANLACLESLAAAGPAPANVRVVRDQGHDTTVKWDPVAGVQYEVFWRDTASAAWQHSTKAGSEGTHTVKGVNKDDWVFAVAASGGIPVEAK